MFRSLTVVAIAVATLAVSAAPGGKMHLEDISLGVITDKKLPKLLDDTQTGWRQRGR